MEQKPFHIIFFPHLSHGHMIPTLDIARLLAERGVKATLLTTKANSPNLSKTLEKDTNSDANISVLTVDFPFREAGLEEGCESIGAVPTKELLPNFYKALRLLQGPLEELLKEHEPNCLVADVMFPWATEAAAKFGIPRLVFHGTCCFAFCVFHSLRTHKPYNNMMSDSDFFVVPGLPDEIKMTRSQLLDHMKGETENHELATLIEQSVESEVTSYGVIVNSFKELEAAYSEHYSKVLGRRAWHIGPVSLCNTNTWDMSQRGKKTSSTSTNKCLKWLDSKEPRSVLYMCFGSMFRFSSAQLLEIAIGVEASGQGFIWVVNEEGEDWLPQGFEERMSEKGLIVRGWAPQVLILEHEAIGGFVTHCGWNSTLEGITAGVPLITWPIYAEQFYNEKLISDVLRAGIGIGAREWGRWDRKVPIPSDVVEEVVRRVMVGQEAEEMRGRAGRLKEMAECATEIGGSSYNDITSLLEELRLNFSDISDYN